MFKCSQDSKVIQPLPDRSGLLPGWHLLFILHELCKTTYGSEKLFDRFWTLRTNENVILRGGKKWSQNKDVRNTIRLEQALICTVSEKSFRCKELSNLTTGFLLRLHCHKRSLHFQGHSTDSPLSLRPAAGAYCIFVPTQTQRLLCEKCWCEKELQRERTSEDKETGRQVPVTSVTILRCGWWQSGRPAFHRISNTAPKARRSSSWSILLWSNGLQGICQKEKLHPCPPAAFSLVQATSFMCILSLVLTPFQIPPKTLLPQAALQYRLTAPASSLCDPLPPDSHSPFLHNRNLAEVLFCWFLCAQSNWFVRIVRRGFWFSLSFVSFHSN